MSRSEPLTSNEILAHLDYLDGWRGLAIVFLLIGHFLPMPGINLDTVGVNLFFVLSGLLMGQLLFLKDTPISLFYKRRISRIIPAHFFFVISILVYYVFTNKAIDWHETFAALTFLTNYFPGELGNPKMPFGHIWSLSVEEHSYILLSVVAVIYRATRLNVLWTILIIALVFAGVGYWNSFHYSGVELYARQLHSEVRAFGILISVFLLLLFGRLQISRISMPVLGVLLSLGILTHWWSVADTVGRTLGVGMLAITVNLLSGAPDIVKRLFCVKWLRMMGLWSYSIYLWQQPFYLAVHKGEIPSVLGALLAILMGIGSYYLLEKPTRGYLNRIWATPKMAQVHPGVV